MSELIKIITAIGLLLAQAGAVMASEIDDYQRSFDNYRQAYSAFEIKKADYAKSPTFAAEEALINSAREMLLLRSDSWSNYWKTMAFSYGTVTSAPETDKSAWKGFFDGEISWLAGHKSMLLEKKVRKELLGEASLLNNRNGAYMSKAVEVNVEIISGRMKDAINQVRQLNATLLDKAKNQKIGTEQQAAAIRGLESNLERLGQVETDLAIIRQDFMDESEFVDKEQFVTISQDFVPLYQQMEQIMSVTRELSKDIQW